MKRNGQVELRALVGHLADHPRIARRRNGDPMSGHAQALFGSDQPDGPGHLRVVGRRFAHAHKDDVGQSPAETLAALGIGQGYLVVDLSGRKIPHPSHARRSAKRTPHPATALARHANRRTVFGRDQHAFHYRAVIEADRIFYRTVFGHLRSYRSDASDVKFLPERLPHRSRKVGHLRKIRRPLLPQPAVHLPPSVSAPAPFGKERTELLPGEGSNVFPVVSIHESKCSEKPPHRRGSTQSFLVQTSADAKKRPPFPPERQPQENRFPRPARARDGSDDYKRSLTPLPGKCMPAVVSSFCLM